MSFDITINGHKYKKCYIEVSSKKTTDALALWCFTPVVSLNVKVLEEMMVC